MHPNPIYRTDDRARILDLAAERGFGLLSINGAEAPLIAHVPFVVEGGRAVGVETDAGHLDVAFRALESVLRERTGLESQLAVIEALGAIDAPRARSIRPARPLPRAAALCAACGTSCSLKARCDSRPKTAIASTSGSRQAAVSGQRGLRRRRASQPTAIIEQSAARPKQTAAAPTSRRSATAIAAASSRSA